MHCHFGIMPEDKIDPQTTYIYILRNTSSDIENYTTMDECKAELPKRFIFGTLKGHALQRANDLLANIFQEALEFQFHEPRIMEESQIAKNKEKLPDNESSHSIRIMDFSRPSDFRLKSIKAKKSG